MVTWHQAGRCRAVRRPLTAMLGDACSCTCGPREHAGMYVDAVAQGTGKAAVTAAISICVVRHCWHVVCCHVMLCVSWVAAAAA